MKNSEKIKKFTILHSNDIHGDFFPEQINNEEESGGLSLLSGYLNKVNGEERNVIFTISGDIVQGNLIDTEYKGISTIEIINYLSPDVISLGNHELDYGLPHLFFLEKMATFPIVNANLYIKKYNKRLFRPYFIKNIDGFDIMFIGIITESVLQTIKTDRTIGTFVDLADAVEEIGRICDAYKNDDIDLTVLLTHIGHEADQELASMLNPEWGVDMILGGHSHTYLKEPAVVNDILIAQAGMGTDQIGRFDILVDDDTNSIVEWEWQLIPISNQTSSVDDDLQKFIDTYKSSVDKKYNSMLCRLDKKLTHPYREYETTLGDFIADITAETMECDISLIGSGSIRVDEFGPVVTLGKIKEMLPYDDCYLRFVLKGEKVWDIFSFILRNENCNHDGECFQVNRKIRAVYDKSKHALQTLYFNGIPIENKKEYSVGIQGFHYQNCEPNLNITQSELLELKGKKVAATSYTTVIEEYLSYPIDIYCPDIEGRLVFIEN